MVSNECIGNDFIRAEQMLLMSSDDVAVCKTVGEAAPLRHGVSLKEWKRPNCDPTTPSSWILTFPRKLSQPKWICT